MEDYQKLAVQLEKQIKNWQNQVTELQKFAPNIDADMKERFEEQLNDINTHMSDAVAKLTELQTANQEAFQDLAKGATKIFEHWQKSWEKAMSRYVS